MPSRAASQAPSTAAWGAKSPPMASTATVGPPAGSAAVAGEDRSGTGADRS